MYRRCCHGAAISPIPRLRPLWDSANLSRLGAVSSVGRDPARRRPRTTQSGEGLGSVGMTWLLETLFDLAVAAWETLRGRRRRR